MRRLTCCAVMLAGLAAAIGARAQSLLDTCHASTSYDVTLYPQGVLFDRTQPAPTRVYLNGGRLRVDRRPITLDAEDSDRVTLMERMIRALEPKVKTIAARAVDLAAQAVREQAAASAPATSDEVDPRVATIASQLKARIKASQSSHDWHDAAFQQYINDSVASIAPLLAAGMVKRAIVAAVSGNFDEAAQLRAHAEHMRDALQARIRAKLQILRPQVAALCPSLRQLDELEAGIHTPLPGGVRIDLVDIASGN